LGWLVPRWIRLLHRWLYFFIIIPISVYVRVGWFFLRLLFAFYLTSGFFTVFSFFFCLRISFRFLLVLCSYVINLFIFVLSHPLRVALRLKPFPASPRHFFCCSGPFFVLTSFFSVLLIICPKMLCSVVVTVFSFIPCLAVPFRAFVGFFVPLPFMFWCFREIPALWWLGVTSLLEPPFVSLSTIELPFFF